MNFWEFLDRNMGELVFLILVLAGMAFAYFGAS
jgi:hypothetical protein